MRNARPLRCFLKLHQEKKDCQVRWGVKPSDSYSLNRYASTLPRMALLRQHASSAPRPARAQAHWLRLVLWPERGLWLSSLNTGGILDGLEECAREGCWRVVSFPSAGLGFGLTLGRSFLEARLPRGGQGARLKAVVGKNSPGSAP